MSGAVTATGSRRRRTGEAEELDAGRLARPPRSTRTSTRVRPPARRRTTFGRRRRRRGRPAAARAASSRSMPPPISYRSPSASRQARSTPVAGPPPSCSASMRRGGSALDGDRGDARSPKASSSQYAVAPSISMMVGRARRERSAWVRPSSGKTGRLRMFFALRAAPCGCETNGSVRPRADRWITQSRPCLDERDPMPLVVGSCLADVPDESVMVHAGHGTILRSSATYLRLHRLRTATRHAHPSGPRVSRRQRARRTR